MDRKDSLTNFGVELYDCDDKVREGKLKITIHRAESLENKDMRGKSDPYVAVYYNNQKQKTKVCQDTLEPYWNESFMFDVKKNGDSQVTFKVKDKDKIKDETMGKIVIDLRKICAAGEMTDVWDNICDGKPGRLLWSAEFSETKTDDDEATTETVNTPPPTTTEDEEPVIHDSDPVTDVPTDDVEDEVVREASLGYIGEIRAGFLKVTVHRAENLVSKDFNGKSDPYVVVRYAGQKNKSKHVEKTLSPVFEFSTGYVLEEAGPGELSVEVKDHDILKNESLGSVVIDLRQVVSDGDVVEQWRPLTGVKHGQVLLSLEFTAHSDQETGEEIVGEREEKFVEFDDDNHLRQRKPTDLGKLELKVHYDEKKEELKLFLNEAENLPGGNLADPPDPYCKVYLMPGKRKKKKTVVVKDTINPKFNAEFDFSVDMKDLHEKYLKIYVIDKKGVFHKSPILGCVDVHFTDSVKNGISGWFPLEPVNEEDSD